jgi:MFS family permease
MLKLFVVFQISWLAFLGPMSSAVANPAFVPMGKAFGITTVRTSYELTVYIIFAGVGPLAVAPLSNVYCRSPIYLLVNLLAGVMNVIAANCSTWTGILVTRVITGIGAGSTVAIGAATVCDLYFMHERGVYMGIYTLFLTNGPHMAPLVGGFIAQYLGWRHCFSIPVSQYIFFM